MLPIWTKALYTQLRQLPIVGRISLKWNRVKVKWKDGLTSNYIFRLTYYNRHRQIFLDKAQAQYKPIKISYQYPWNPLDSEDKKHKISYFIATRRDINKGTALSKDVLLHNLIIRMLRKPAPYYPDDRIIIKELAYIARNDAPFTPEGIFLLSPSVREASELIYKYFDIYKIKRGLWTLQEALRDKWILRAAINKLINAKGKAITVNRIIRQINGYYGAKWPATSFYKVLFRQMFGTNRNISDYHPYLGVKALATTYLDCTYCPKGEFNYKPGYLEAIGLQLDDDKGDVAIYDNNFQPYDYKTVIQQIMPNYRTSLFYVEKKLPDIPPPTRIIKFKTMKFGEIKFLYLYRT